MRQMWPAVPRAEGIDLIRHGPCPHPHELSHGENRLANNAPNTVR